MNATLIKNTSAHAEAQERSGRSQTSARRGGVPRLRLASVSREAKRLAAALLEVLAGTRTPAAAAEALEISLARYYVLESRALQGMLEACEPRPKGRLRSAASEQAALARECQRLRRDCARQQALLRAAQRTVGLSPPAPAKPDGAGKKRRQRKPTARALKAAAWLREREQEAGAAAAPLASAIPTS